VAGQMFESSVFTASLVRDLDRFLMGSSYTYITPKGDIRMFPINLRKIISNTIGPRDVYSHIQ
jgi:hypothetical protein